MKKLLVLLLAVAMVFAMTGCGSKDSGSGEEGGDSEAPIKIGFFAPVSAPAASADGTSSLNSAKLAVKICNENGGINGRQVELVDYDDKLDATEAANIAEKLASDDSIAAVVSGSYSGPTKVAAPIFQDAGKLMVSAYAVHPDVVNAGDLIFSQSFPQALQGAAAAKYATETLKAKKVAIISVDLDFGSAQVEGFKAQLKKMNSPIKIVYEQAIDIADNDMSSPVTAAAAKGADLIYSVNYYEQAAQVLREVGQKKLDIPVLGCEGADSFELLNIAGEYADGLYITTNMNRDSKDDQIVAYIDNYVKEYDIQPDLVGASVYDAFQVVFAALDECGADTQKMKEYIAGLENFDTVTGTLIRYNPDGSAVKPVQIQLVTDGEYHSAGVIDDPEIIDPSKY